jgi:hypothetical protein
MGSKQDAIQDIILNDILQGTIFVATLNIRANILMIPPENTFAKIPSDT